MTTQDSNELTEKSVGAMLREARSARSIALDDAARVTRIGKAYLSALEEERFDKLPSAVYAKGFLRVYAHYLGLPENEIIHLYEQESVVPPSAPVEQTAETDKVHARKKFVLPVPRRWYLPVLLLALSVMIASLLIITLSGRKGREPLPAPVTATSKPVTAVPTAAQPVQPSPEEGRRDETPEDQSETKKQEATGATPPAGKGMFLKMKVIEDSWLDITIDDTIRQHYELKSGDVIEWKGEKKFTLDLGNAGGVEIELNGKPMKKFGASGEPAHVSLKAEDVQG